MSIVYVHMPPLHSKHESVHGPCLLGMTNNGARPYSSWQHFCTDSVPSIHALLQHSVVTNNICTLVLVGPGPTIKRPFVSTSWQLETHFVAPKQHEHLSG
jgi:hypothetical protein